MYMYVFLYMYFLVSSVVQKFEKLLFLNVTYIYYRKQCMLLDSSVIYHKANTQPPLRSRYSSSGLTEQTPSSL